MSAQTWGQNNAFGQYGLTVLREHIPVADQAVVKGAKTLLKFTLIGLCHLDQKSLFNPFIQLDKAFS